MQADPISVLFKIQKFLKEETESAVSILAHGGVDSMENYKYITGRIQALDQITQEISNLLNPKEPNKNEENVTPIRR